MLARCEIVGVPEPETPFQLAPTFHWWEDLPNVARNRFTNKLRIVGIRPFHNMFRVRFPRRLPRRPPQVISSPSTHYLTPRCLHPIGSRQFVTSFPKHPLVAAPQRCYPLQYCNREPHQPFSQSQPTPHRPLHVLAWLGRPFPFQIAKREAAPHWSQGEGYERIVFLSFQPGT